MIEFAYLIHKETDFIISYGQWLGFLEKDDIDFYFQKPIRYNGGLSELDKIETNHYSYNPKEMLLSDDFKII